MILLIIAIAIGVYLGNIAFKKECDRPGTVATAVLKFRYCLKYTVLTILGSLTALGLLGGLANMITG